MEASRLRPLSSLHAQPSHDTLYMTSSSAARCTSTQGLPPSVERRVEACQKSVLAASHWSPGVSWAVGRRCTVTCCFAADTLELLRVGLDRMRCDVDGAWSVMVMMRLGEVESLNRSELSSSGSKIT